VELAADAEREYDRALAQFRGALRQFAASVAAESAAVKNAPSHPIPEGILTPRECEALTLIALGKSGKEVAHLLGISFRTVVCHRYRISRKLGVHNLADLTRAAIRMGLIDL
jgi:DNA-binding NarL/FixJ family response regulator